MLSCLVELQVALGLYYVRARSRNIAADTDTKYEMLSPLIPSPSEAQYQLAHTSDNQSSQILVSHYICLPLATIAVILRLLSRYLCKAARLQADDYIIIAAWVFFSPIDSNVKFPFGVS